MTQTIEQLQAKVAELEAENARLKTESRDACLGLNDYYGMKLADEQLNNKRLLEALDKTRGALAYVKANGRDNPNLMESTAWHGLAAADKALAIPSSTEALDKYVAEKVKDVQLQDIEQYLLQMAGISTAAIGYWKEGDSIHPDYDTPTIRDVAKLYANYESRTRQRDLAVEALEAIAGRRIFIDNLASNVDIAAMTLDTIKESEAK